MLASWNWNPVSLMCTVALFWYLATKPNVAFKVVQGSHPNAPYGDSNQPPPVAKLPYRSQTTMKALDQTFGWRTNDDDAVVTSVCEGISTSITEMVDLDPVNRGRCFAESGAERRLALTVWRVP